MKLVLLSAALVMAALPAEAQQPAPLFASDEPVRITLTGPMANLQRDRSETPRPGTMVSGAESHAITLTPRGLTRRKDETCQFPPLRVVLPQRTASGLFEGQRSLKLVTHCRSPESFQQHVLLEYAAYRLLNVLTPASLKVRLADIDYRFPDGKLFTRRFGFFIEDWDDAARRTGHSRPRVGDAILASQLSPSDAARAALFQYMIGNLDWSMRAGPPGEGCCHNFRLFSRPGAGGFVPIPYDFDYSGLVDAPYAVPPEGINVGDVRKRRYRGYCAHNPQALTTATNFRSKRAELMVVLATIPGLAEGSRRKASGYLDRFFADIADDERTRSRVLGSCFR